MSGRKAQDKVVLTSSVSLRDISVDHLPIFFENQLDETANQMAPVVSTLSGDCEAAENEFPKAFAAWQQLQKMSMFTNNTQTDYELLVRYYSRFLEHHGRPDAAKQWLDKADQSRREFDREERMLGWWKQPRGKN
jgi:hypothetical protein